MKTSEDKPVLRTDPLEGVLETDDQFAPKTPDHTSSCSEWLAANNKAKFLFFINTSDISHEGSEIIARGGRALEA